jgi:hypothetical protein
VEPPLLLQFSIALFTGMVAATFVPSVRKSIPPLVEVGLWIALITACVMGVMSVTDTNARELGSSTLWGVSQVMNTIVGLLLGGVVGWISDLRFVISAWLVIAAGADLVALMVLNSFRSATPPRVRLRDWMELPVPAGVAPLRQPRLADPLLGINRRLAAASAVLVMAVLARSLDLAIWVRNVMMPHGVRGLARAAGASRVGSRARLESLRDATAHLGFAARSWYVAAGQPAVSGVAGHAAGAMRATERGLRRVAARPGQVVDIQALLSAQSIGWYGPLGAEPVELTRGEDDEGRSQRQDSLAS